MTTVYLNGQFLPKGEAKISVEDRGFHFGDGVYEVVRVIEGRLFAWDAHAARMADGLNGLRIGREGSESATLRSVCERLVKENAHTAPGEVNRGRRSSRPGTDNEDVVLLHARSMQAAR